MRRKKKLMLTIFTVGILVLAAASFVLADYVANAKPIDNVKGTVVFRYGGGFFLKTDSKEYKLVVGPPWYLDDLGLKLKNGEAVTVSGAVDEDEGVLFVSTIKKGARTYKIADPDKVTDFSFANTHRRGFIGRCGGNRYDGRGQMMEKGEGRGHGRWSDND